jgi:hypothetical protein
MRRPRLPFALVSALAVVSGCSSTEPGECNLSTYPNQCVDRATLWAAVEHGDAGSSVPADCPTVNELNSEMVNAYGIGLEGWNFIEGPVLDTATDRCCYTTRAAPCE